MNVFLKKVLILFLFLFSFNYNLTSYASGNTFYGDSGAISSPTAEMKDRQFDIGLSYMKGERSYLRTGVPNLIYSFSINLIPRVEVGLSYNQIFTGIQDSDNPYLKNSSFDRSAFAKIQVLDESNFIPAIALGGRDLFSNSVVNYRGPLLTSYQQSFYGVLGKKIYDFELNLGYAYSPSRPLSFTKIGSESAELIFSNSFRLNGIFASIETPKLLNYFSGIFEYDTKYLNYGIHFSNFYGIDLKAVMIDISNFNIKLSFNNRI